MTDKKETGVQQENVLALLRQYNPSETLTYPKDLLAGRYRVLVNQPLEELSSPFATAYAVNDEQSLGMALYALVYDNQSPIRQRHIEILKEFRHPNMVSLLDNGVVEISVLSESRYVAILEKPPGRSLSSLLSERKYPVSQTVLISAMLRPLVEILLAFSKAGISHNRINLNNVYLDKNKIILGECVSEPSGFSQDYLFEPIERILTHPFAKSDHATYADCYALAVLVLHLILGFQPFTDIDKDGFIEAIITKGSYHTLVIQWDLSETMQDFFRGLLNDARRERWDPESINAWLGGKRFNLILPSVPNEATRGFDYAGKIHYNRKSVAYAIYRRWQEDAYVILSDSKLGRWVETSVRRPEAGEMIVRLSANTNSDNVRYERQNSELVARTLILLDPTGPIRFKHLTVTIDGVGNIFTDAILSGKQGDIQTVVQILEADLPWFWVEHQVGVHDYTSVTWKLQRVRSYMRINTLGFGTERCVYELNPGLACQSKLVKRYHISNLHDLMMVLDMIASQKAEQDDFMDRHIIGFIAAKLDIGKEVKVNELDVLPKLSSHPGLIGLKLLMKVQGKMENKSLRGLCYWVAVRLLPLVGNIHKRSHRHKLQKDLIEAAGTGSFKAMAGILLNPEVFAADHNGFIKMAADYAIRKRHIEELKNNTVLTRHSRVAGRGIAQTIAYGICLATVYYTLRAYYHF